MIPLVTASEVGKAQAKIILVMSCSVKTIMKVMKYWIWLESQVVEGDNPVQYGVMLRMIVRGVELFGIATRSWW